MRIFVETAISTALFFIIMNFAKNFTLSIQPIYSLPEQPVMLLIASLVISIAASILRHSKKHHPDNDA